MMKWRNNKIHLNILKISAITLHQQQYLIGNRNSSIK